MTRDSCGCAMGARFLGAALAASSAWFVWHRSEYSFAHAGVRTLVFAFAAALLGKLVGIALYRLRARTVRGIPGRLSFLFGSTEPRP